MPPYPCRHSKNCKGDKGWEYMGKGIPPVVLFVTVWLPVLICFHTGFPLHQPIACFVSALKPYQVWEQLCSPWTSWHRQAEPEMILWDAERLQYPPGVLWSRLGSGGTDGDCLFPSDLARQQLRGGGGPFHLQWGIWHRISSWWWDAEWEQNKFIQKELLCPDNRPIGRRGKLCIYMQCGGLARLLSGLRALSWLDFNMTDSHQVQTQMGDIGILPREDWNSSWHSESCTGDGQFSETG